LFSEFVLVPSREVREKERDNKGRRRMRKLRKV
jgi:hypothetical protein